MRGLVIRLAAVLLLSLIPLISNAQDFSADVVYLAPANPKAPSSGTTNSVGHTSKLYVSKDKMRLETRGVTGTILLVDNSENSVMALFPSQKAYQPLANPPAEYFRVKDAENACPDWKEATVQKLDCEKVGHEKVDGRDTVKYQNKAAAGDGPTAVWIDPALKFVAKWESPQTGAELRNITEAQQAADLFVVPRGYNPLQPKKASSKGFTKRSH
jgi:hypothetical protein